MLEALNIDKLSFLQKHHLEVIYLHFTKKVCLVLILKQTYANVKKRWRFLLGRRHHHFGCLLRLSLRGEENTWPVFFRLKWILSIRRKHCSATVNVFSLKNEENQIKLNMKTNNSDSRQDNHLYDPIRIYQIETSFHV